MSARLMAMAVLGFLAFLAGCRADSPYHVKDGAWYWKDDRLDLPASAALNPLNGSFAIANGLVRDADPQTFTVPR